MLFDLIEEAKKVISINSVSDTGNRRLVEHLIPYCEKLGLHVTLQAAVNGHARADVNLIAHTRPPGDGDRCPEGVALVTHLDTVPPGDTSLWTETGGDPFRATLKGDRIYGLGSADTKLDFLCKLLALEAVDPRQLKVPVALVGTFGEERSLAGARLLQDSGLVRPKFALVGEPSELRPVNAHKGILYLRATWTSPPAPLLSKERGAEGGVRSFQGRAAHGSMPHLGENAVTKAAHWLFERLKKEPNLQLLNIHGGTVHNIVPEQCGIEVGAGTSACRRITFLKNFFQLMERAEIYLATHQNPAFDPPRTTANVGVIRGDESKIEIEFDFRLIPETDGNALFEIFQALGRDLPEARVDVVRSNAPMATDPDSQIAEYVSQALKTVGLPMRFWAKAGNTEGAVFNAMGAETVVIGPGKSVGNIHAPNEYNEISQLKKAVEFYTAFLGQFC